MTINQLARLYTALGIMQWQIEQLRKHDSMIVESHFDDTVPNNYAVRVLAGIATDDDDRELLAMINRCEIAPDQTPADLRQLHAVRSNIK